MPFQKNIELLQRRYPEIFNKLKGFLIDKGTYIIEKTKIGLPTVKIKLRQREIYLHSKYNPIKEAEKFAEDYHEDNKVFIIYGLGLAYHITKLLEENKNSMFYIFESNLNIIKLALENMELEDLILNERVMIVFEDNIKEFSMKFGDALRLKNSKLIIHQPSLQSMPDALVDIKYVLEDFRIKENMMRDTSLLDKNFEYNIEHFDSNIDVLFGRFEGHPLILVSAGPSLDMNKRQLIEAKNKAIILAVGTAVKPLLEVGITPDLIIMTDPHDIVYQQISNLNLAIPIILLSTCNLNVTKNYKGFKFLALQHHYAPAEEFANKHHATLIHTGGSVATTALDIAIRFGCNPIIFVGQDLALTDGKSHAQGTQQYNEITNYKNLRQIKGITGEQLYTSKSLYIYLKWIENRIQQEKQIAFVNATEYGASILGTTPMRLEQVVRELLENKSNAFLDILAQMTGVNGIDRNHNL